jgi:methionyl-tRNA formyltransferase
MPTVAVLGKGDLAIRIAEFFTAPECSFTLVGVVPVLPEPAWTASFSDWAHSRQVSMFDHYRDLPDGIDLAFSCFYDKILPSEFIRREKKVVNLHNGPLPRYRGVNPINWALKNGEREHGVTIHEVTPGIDDGPILAQVKYSIYPEIEEVRDVYVKALEFGWTLFRMTIGSLLEIQGVEQDHSQASYYGKRDFERLGDRSAWTRSERGRH